MLEMLSNYNGNTVLLQVFQLGVVKCYSISGGRLVKSYVTY